MYITVIMGRYARNNSAVFSLKYHIVWCPKYRRPVLSESIAARLLEVLNLVCAEFDWTLHEHEIMSDHVHLFIETGPTEPVAEVVNRLKGRSSRILRNEFPELRSKLPTLWTRSYYAGSVGNVSEATVRRYIENQKGK